MYWSVISLHCSTAPQWVMATSLSKLHDYTQTHHTQWDSSGLVMSLMQRPLPDITHHSQQKTSTPLGGMQLPNPSNRAVADPRLRPRRHWDRHLYGYNTVYIQCVCCCKNSNLWLKIYRTNKWFSNLKLVQNLSKTVKRAPCPDFHGNQIAITASNTNIQ